MKQRPILFSTPMVQAILEGRKTQTRRVCKRLIGSTGVKDVYHRPDGLFVGLHLKRGDGQAIMNPFSCPYGKPGDVLWVRETWCRAIDEPVSFLYKASHPEAWDNETGGSPWRPSIHMPKAAARIWLQIESVRVERLHEISEEDAINEGSKAGDPTAYSFTFSKLTTEDHSQLEYRAGFAELWCKINGPESWDANPWVWVVEFKRIEKPI